nr:unnamed protein product [Callosobruchus analis]
MTRPLGARIRQIQNDIQITFPEAHARGPPAIPHGYLGKSAPGQIAPSIKKMLHILIYISNYLEISQIPMITREILYLPMGQRQKKV